MGEWGEASRHEQSKEASDDPKAKATPAEQSQEGKTGKVHTGT